MVQAGKRITAKGVGKAWAAPAVPRRTFLKINVDPGLISPKREKSPLKPGHPHINKEGFINPGSTLL